MILPQAQRISEMGNLESFTSLSRHQRQFLVESFGKTIHNRGQVWILSLWTQTCVIGAESRIICGEPKHCSSYSNLQYRIRLNDTKIIAGRWPTMQPYTGWRRWSWTNFCLDHYRYWQNQLLESRPLSQAQICNLMLTKGSAGTADASPCTASSTSMSDLQTAAHAHVPFRLYLTGRIHIVTNMKSLNSSFSFYQSFMLWIFGEHMQRYWLTDLNQCPCSNHPNQSN